MMRLLLLLLAFAGTVQPASAQSNYPDHPVRIIDPFPAGSGTDIACRVLAQKLSERFGQQFIVDNRPGASGNLGSEIIAKSPSDGYTLGLVTASTHGVAPAVDPKLPYDPIKDFKPVSMIGAAPYVLVVYPGLGVKSLSDLVKLAKTKPGQLTYGSAGPASLAHLAAALFATDMGVELTHVPYKSSSQSAVDIMAGRLDMQFAMVGPAIPTLREGKILALATSGAKRVSSLPEIPTVIEAGVKGFDVALWIAFVMPAQTPDPIVTKLNEAMSDILKQPDVIAALQLQGFDPLPGPPSLVTEQIKSETTRWRELVAKTGLKVQ